MVESKIEFIVQSNVSSLIIEYIENLIEYKIDSAKNCDDREGEINVCV